MHVYIYIYMYIYAHTYIFIGQGGRREDQQALRGAGQGGSANLVYNIIVYD